ncbi:tyrosine-type recombinase/integrase [Botrimarina sp.]|uniref:tyrosine-type recombinase/integrase n=1 Tax=Botrimarina sp. TaxID=2795802 RepID=UPI0032EE30E1
MATLSKEPDAKSKRTGKVLRGGYRIQVMIDGQRRSIRLGKMPKAQADNARRHVEALASARIDGSAPPEPTAAWVGGLSDTLRGRLERAGLVRPRDARSGMTVGELVDKFRASKFPNYKPRSKATVDMGLKAVLRIMGSETLVRDVTPGDCEDYSNQLKSEGLSKATVHKRCSIATSLFRYAMKHRIIDREPFADSDVKRSTVATTRRAIISEADAKLVLDKLPDAEWRLLFVLSRWGGLRVGSEPRTLKWSDVDWQRMRIRVRSPKTEHHEGHASREVPIFPEIEAELRDVWEAAEPGEEWVLPFLRSRTDSALRKPLKAAIKRAGLEVWPRLFHNMRATRQTELEQRFPSHVVCKWLGNSVQIANKHYLSVTDDDFARATEKTVQNPGQTADDTGGQAATTQNPDASEPTESPEESSPVTPCPTGRATPSIGSRSSTRGRPRSIWTAGSSTAWVTRPSPTTPRRRSDRS